MGYLDKKQYYDESMIITLDCLISLVDHLYLLKSSLPNFYLMSKIGLKLDDIEDIQNGSMNLDKKENFIEYTANPLLHQKEMGRNHEHRFDEENNDTFAQE